MLEPYLPFLALEPHGATRPPTAPMIVGAGQGQGRNFEPAVPAHFVSPNRRARLLYLEGYTDATRANLERFLLPPATGVQKPALTFFLPPNLVAAYGFSTAVTDASAGAKRADWLALFDSLEPAAGTELIRTQRGGLLSVWRGPQAPALLSYPDPLPHPTTPPTAPADTDGWDQCSYQGCRFWVNAARTVNHLLLIHDGALWYSNRLGWVLQQLQVPGLAVVLIDTMDPQRRAHELPHYEPARALTTMGIEVAQAHFHQTFSPRQITVAGQSFGALAAAAATVGKPLAHRAICQSPSWWHPAGADILARSQRARREALAAPVRVDLSVGANETRKKMIPRAQQAAGILAANGMKTQLHYFGGGHSWACWRDALVEVLSHW